MSKVVAKLPSPGMSYLTKFTRECVQERMQGAGDDKGVRTTDDHSFLTQVLRMYREQPERFTMVDVFSTCITNIGAGSDTTSISLSGILLNLILNPETLQKASKHLISLIFFEVLHLSSSNFANCGPFNSFVPSLTRSPRQVSCPARQPSRKRRNFHSCKLVSKRVYECTP